MTTRYIYTAADWDANPTDYTLRKYSDAGVLQWSTNLYDADDGSAPDEQALAVDPDGYVYTVNNGVYIGGSTLVEVVKWKTDGSGYEWAKWYQGGTGQNAIAVLPDGNVVYGSARGADGVGGYRNVTLLDGDDGTELWHKDTGGAQAMTVCADIDGNVYAGGTRVGTDSIWAWDEGGNALWTADFGALVYHMAVLGDYLYVVGTYNGSASVRKFALADGAEVTSGGFPIDVGVTVRRVALDLAGVLYLGYYGSDTLGHLAAYSPAGEALWNNSVAYTPGGVAVSPDGIVYEGGDVDTYGVDPSVRAYNAATGDEITDGWPLTAATIVNDVAVSPGLVGAFPGGGGWLPAPSITVGDVLYE